MRLRILYFAQAARLRGVAEEEISLRDGVTLADAQRELLTAHPALVDLAPLLRWAVDEEFAPEDQVLGDGATLALLPPFSGG